MPALEKYELLPDAVIVDCAEIAAESVMNCR